MAPSGARLATRHLRDLGHRHVAFIGGNDVSPSRQARFEGYASVLRDDDVRVRDAYTTTHPSDRGEAAARFADFIRERPEVSAVVACDDTIAFGIMLGMQRAGLTPGLDVAIVGFNDLPEAAHWTPALTTVSVDARELGAELARLFLERREDSTATPRSVSRPVELVVRDSCGTARRGSG